ncbi:hypothetical protein BDY19DRAFT_99026 [Irpex rosettiformis]|uniref:Uncharacterized protein n=1 Tax=Irpex rosettiformis TaxID=378272 RepID=A0ACB8U6Y8_9APHY|nr:hypothetical protein BDY19DRAFT_99026 [Irpex rosettiformis]
MAGEMDVEFMAGPLLALICFALILFGVFTAQIYYYWLSYEDDSPFLRHYVCALWLLEVAHTILCVQIVYHYLIIHFGNTESGLDRIVWSFPATIVLEVCIVCMSQGMYIYRIWYLSKKSMLVAGVPVCSTAQTSIMYLYSTSYSLSSYCPAHVRTSDWFAKLWISGLTVRLLGFSLASVAFLYRYDTWVNFHAHRAPPATVTSAFSLAVMTDISVASLLVYYLYVRTTVTFARTRHIVQTLMLYTINTGAITILFSVGVLATFNLFKMSLLFGGLIEIISKLYANSMLAMLNARQTILNRDREGADVFTSVELTRPRVQETRVQIYTETSITQDDLTRRPNARDPSPDAYTKDSAKLDVTYDIAHA